jgi:hypothetical protein
MDVPPDQLIMVSELDVESLSLILNSADGSVNPG